MEIKEQNFSLDLLLKETLELSEFIGSNNEYQLETNLDEKEEECFMQLELSANDENEYFMDLADSVLIPPVDFSCQVNPDFDLKKYPESVGLVYRIDESGGTFCVRGLTSLNIQETFKEISKADSSKRSVLKLSEADDLEKIYFFKTKTIELADSIKENIINRRFPKVEDSVCNIADPGFSWWMDVGLREGEGRFEIFFKSHGVNRAEKYIQLGPIGDGAIAALRLNQARTLLRSSFPITEFVCTDRSLSLVTNKPDHLSFLSFKNIFLLGENHTQIENFPDNTLGRTLYFYFHEVASIRKFWIEVQARLS